MTKKMPREMTGAELQSMLKSTINFKSLGGLKDPDLKLSREDLKWWREARVGMFVHWGLYSILGRGEWARFNEGIPEAEYEKLAWEFNPVDFDMEEWAELASDFGAKYMVMVARHHDGFALWDSPGSYGGFTSSKTASKRDFIREYTEACRRHGLRVGIYYSLMDWRFPGYFNPEGLLDNALLMKKQTYDQVNELCGNYGPVDIIWYDGAWLAHKGSDTTSAWLWDPVKLNKEVRSHNPKTLINPRSGWEGDFYCDEGSHEIKGGIIPVPWEKNMCVASGASWGWMPEDPVTDFDDLIVMMANVVTRGGNWLLNVAPDRNGKVPADAARRMREIGRWLRENGESVYGTEAGPFEPVDGVFGSTFRENTVYLHILDSKAFSQYLLPPLPHTVLAASYKGKALEFIQGAEGIKIKLPEGIAKEPDTLVRLTLDGKPSAQEDADIYFTGKA